MSDKINNEGLMPCEYFFRSPKIAKTEIFFSKVSISISTNNWSRETKLLF